MKIFKYALELLYPRRCPACDRPVKLSMLCCEECEKTFVRILDNYCMKCGKPLEDEGAEYCESCKKIRHRYSRGRALYHYKTVNEAIYRFKYSGRAEYAEYFGKQMAMEFKKEISEWNPELIIPIPLHATRQRKRGYNQAALLAKTLSEFLDIPYDNHFVIRSRKTTPMKELNGLERQINLKNSFIVRDNDVKLRRVLLVDDIYTTGSTIDAVSAELIKAGIEEIYFVSLSIGSGV